MSQISLFAWNVCSELNQGWRSGEARGSWEGKREAEREVARGSQVRSPPVSWAYRVWCFYMSYFTPLIFDYSCSLLVWCCRERKKEDRSHDRRDRDEDRDRDRGREYDRDRDEDRDRDRGREYDRDRDEDRDRDRDRGRGDYDRSSRRDRDRCVHTICYRPEYHQSSSMASMIIIFGACNKSMRFLSEVSPLHFRDGYDDRDRDRDRGRSHRDRCTHHMGSSWGVLIYIKLRLDWHWIWYGFSVLIAGMMIVRDVIEGARDPFRPTGTGTGGGDGTAPLKRTESGSRVARGTEGRRGRVPRGVAARRRSRRQLWLCLLPGRAPKLWTWMIQRSSLQTLKEPSLDWSHWDRMLRFGMYTVVMFLHTVPYYLALSLDFPWIPTFSWMTNQYTTRQSLSHH